MKTYYNHKQYLSFIIDKYTNSLKYYDKIIDDDSELFLTYYESMNVFPIYPRPIIMPLKKIGESYDIKLEIHSNIPKIDINNINKTTENLNKKLIEFNDATSKIRELKNQKKIRRFFDYEIRDAIKNKLNDDGISNAWIKIFEILNTYNLFNNNTDTINTFHICEHPGKFIFGIKYFVTNILKKKHEYIFQSLKPNNNPKIFKPDKKLNFNNLDYGPKNGDITNKDNLIYYHEKYKDRHFDLITSDCGLDFSENFVGQESGLYKIFLGALICAISVSTNGTNYIFKLFSFNDLKTIELLQLACLFFERVDLVRLLTDKSGSGEIYCVCINYNYSADKKYILDILLKYNDTQEKYLLHDFNKKFISRLKVNHELLSMRRITSINLLLFRLNNYEFSQKNPIVIQFVQHFVDYYTNYFLTYIGF